MRLMYSGRDFAWLYDRQIRVSFLDGHVLAFALFGAVLLRLIREPARRGRKVLVGADRKTHAPLRGARGVPRVRAMLRAPARRPRQARNSSPRPVVT